jgi:hypothetical protein
MAAEMKKSVLAAILDILKNSIEFESCSNTKWMQKEDWKNIGYSLSYVKKTDFDPPFWIFWLIWQKYALDSCCWQKYKRIGKSERKNIGQCLKLCYFEFRPTKRTSDAILNLTKSFFFCEICPTKIQAQRAQIIKHNAKKFKIHWENQFFSHIENHRHFENLWKNFPIFF